jgi:hypothetical protein
VEDRLFALGALPGGVRTFLALDFWNFEDPPAARLLAAFG